MTKIWFSIKFAKKWIPCDLIKIFNIQVHLQAALVICRIFICCFAYSRPKILPFLRNLALHLCTFIGLNICGFVICSTFIWETYPVQKTMETCTVKAALCNHRLILTTTYQMPYLLKINKYHRLLLSFLDWPCNDHIMWLL